MAAGRVDIAVGLQDDELKKGLKNIPKQFKKAGLEQFVKLKLDASDFRVQVQQEVKEAMKAAKKAGALSYMNKAGQKVDVDPTSWKSTSDAIKRFSDLGLNSQIKALERLRASLYLLGNDYKQNTAQIKGQLEMPTRIARAQNSGMVQAERQRIAREAAQKERLLTIEKQLADIERRRLDNQKMTVDGRQRLQNEIQLLQQKIAKLREIDRIQNGGKASGATLAAEAQLRNLQHTNSLLQQQGGILGKLKGLAQQYLSIFAVWNFGRKIVDTTGYFEQQKVALEGILGSAADAEKAFTRMQKMALQSPFELKEIVGQTKQAAAYGIGDGDTKKLLDDVKMLGDLSAGLGVDMQRLILAYGQVKAAAVLRGQELRQFTEAGIPMVQALADKFTQLNGKLVTTGEVFELISKRQVSFEMVASVMRDMTAEGGKFNDMQEKITETLYGQVQKLKDMWTQELNNLGSGMGKFLMNIVKGFQTLVKSARAISIAGLFLAGAAAVKKLGIGLLQLSKNVGGVKRAFANMRAEIAAANLEMEKSARSMGKIKAVARGFGSALSSIAASGIGIALSAAAGVVMQIVQAKKELDNKFKDIESSFAKDAAKMENGLDNLISKIRTFSYDTKAYNDAMDTLKANYGDYISSSLIQRIEDEKKGIDDLTISWQNLANAVKEAIREQNQYKKSEAKAEAAGNKIIENATDDKWYKLGMSSFEEYYRLGSLPYARKGSNSTSDTTAKQNNILAQKDIANEVIKRALSYFTEDKQTSKDKFKEYVLREAKDEHNVVLESYLKNSNVLDEFFDDWSGSDDFKKYKKAVSDYKDSPLYKIQKAFEDAEKAAQGYEQGRFRGDRDSEEYTSAKSKSAQTYNPRQFDNAREAEILTHTKKLLEDKDFFGDINEEIVNKKGENIKELFEKAFALKYDEAGNIMPANGAGQTKQVADVINDLIGTLNDENDAKKIERLNNILDEFMKRAGTLSGEAKQVADDFYSFFEKTNSVEMEQFFNRYIPKDQTFDEMVNKVTADRKSTAEWLEKNAKWANDKGEKGKKYAQMKQEKEWLDIIWGGKEGYGKFYAQTEKAKKGGGGGKTIRRADFLNDLLAYVKKANDAVEKIAGVEGFTGAMTDFVDNLSADNFLKPFFEEGATPFQKFFDEMSKYGMTKDMVPGLDSDVLKTIMREAGWEEGMQLSVPDFQKMYKAILDYFSTKVVPLIKDDKERTSLEKVIGDKRLEYEKLFGFDEIERELKAAVKSLTDIQENTKRLNEKRSLYEELRGAGGHKAAYNATFNPLEGESRYSSAIAGMASALYASPFKDTEEGKALMKVLKSSRAPDKKMRKMGEIQERIAKRQEKLDKKADSNDGTHDDVVKAQAYKDMSEPFVTSIKSTMDAWADLEEERKAKIAHLYDPRIDAQESLLNLFSVAGGDGIMGTNAGQEMFQLLSSGAKLNLSNLQNLYNFRNRLTDMTGEKFVTANTDEERKNAKQFQDVAKVFDDAIVEMINAIKKAYKDIPRTNIEKAAVSLENFFDTFNKNQMIIDEEGGTLKNQRSIENAKQLFDNIAKQLGGTGNLPFVRTGKRMDIGMQAFYGAQLGKMNLQQYFGNMLAKATNEDNMEKSARRAEELNALFEISNAIVKFTTDAIQGLGDAAKATIRAFRSFNKVIRAQEDSNGYLRIDRIIDEAYLKIMEASVDAAMSFSQHISGAWTKLLSLDLVGAGAELYSAFADLIASLNSISDQKIQIEIDSLQEDIKSLDKSIDRASFQAKHMSGIDAMNKQGENIFDYLDKYNKFIESYNKELTKKNSDEDALRTFYDGAEEAKRAAMDAWQSLKQEIAGTADELSSTLTDAFVNAFKNGTNAARDWAAAVKEYMGQVLQTMLLEKVLAPKIQKIIDEWMGGTDEEILTMFTDKDGNVDKEAMGNYIESRMSDEDAGKEAEQKLYALGDWAQDFYSGLGEWTKDMIAFNNDTSTLSGGIESMTEDTGRTLEGLGNSILMQHVLTNQKLDEVKALPFAQVQTSWFKDIQVQAQAIATATKALNSAVEDVRNGIRPIHVTMQ